VVACNLALRPTSLSPFSEMATMEDVVSDPSALFMTTGLPSSNTATTEFDVPKLMPMIFFGILFTLFNNDINLTKTQ
jgi:hypothetical protein